MKNYYSHEDINFILVLITTIILGILLVWAWVNGISDMHRDYPDYRGDDLFGEDTNKDI